MLWIALELSNLKLGLTQSYLYRLKVEARLKMAESRNVATGRYK